MKKIFVSFILLFIACCNVKALDERSILDSVEATSNIDLVISYAGSIEAPTFNITVGNEAHIVNGEGGWYWYNGERWLHRTNGYKFRSGKWNYRIQLRIDGEYGESLRLANQTVVKINGVNWSFSYKGSGDDYSYGIAISPTYNLVASGELNFFDDQDCRVYTSYIDNAIIPRSVTSLVEGGVEPYVFTKEHGPAWVNVSEDGVISGTPTEVGTNDNLIIRVTDQEDNYKEIVYYVDKTILSPGLRELIPSITANSNISTIPVIGQNIVHPTFNITNVDGPFFANYAGKWYKKIGSNYQEQTGEFTPGIWQYRTEVVLEGVPAETHRLSDDTVVLVDGVDWNAALSGVANEFYSLSVKSPEYTLTGKINSIELRGDISIPKVGNDIINPSIGIESINNDNTLINIASVEAVWQYKTGDSFFDWEDASGKFEEGKIYHIRLFITIDSDIYELENIADFPIIYNDYELVQFQLNNKTVGKYIEFNISEPISIPIVKIKNDNNKITLTWDSQDEAVKYKVYRSTDGKKYNKVSDVKDNSFVDKSLTYGKTYYYKVKSCDTTKCTSYSDVVSKKIKPNKVVLSIKSAGTNNIKLTWDKVSTTGYQISRSTDNKTWTNIKTISGNNTLEFDNKSLKANKIYYYKVRAYKTVSGKRTYGSWSSVVSTRTAPVKPKVTLSIKDYNKININIEESKGANHYIIYKSIDDKTYNKIVDISSYGAVEDGENEVGKTYYYRVKVCNKYNNCSGKVTLSIKQTPKTPSLKVESTSTKKVSVKVGSVNGADGYRVYRSTSKNGKYELVKIIYNGDEMTFNDTTKKGITYYYKVRSYKVVNGSKVYSSFGGIKKVLSI